MEKCTIRRNVKLRNTKLRKMKLRNIKLRNKKKETFRPSVQIFQKFKNFQPKIINITFVKTHFEMFRLFSTKSILDQPTNLSRFLQFHVSQFHTSQFHFSQLHFAHRDGSQFQVVLILSCSSAE